MKDNLDGHEIIWSQPFFLQNTWALLFNITALSVTEKRVEHFTQGNFFRPELTYLMARKKKGRGAGSGAISWFLQNAVPAW